MAESRRSALEQCARQSGSSWMQDSRHQQPDRGAADEPGDDRMSSPRLSSTDTAPTYNANPDHRFARPSLPGRGAHASYFGRSQLQARRHPAGRHAAERAIAGGLGGLLGHGDLAPCREKPGDGRLGGARGDAAHGGVGGVLLVAARRAGVGESNTGGRLPAQDGAAYRHSSARPVVRRGALARAGLPLAPCVVASPFP